LAKSTVVISLLRGINVGGKHLIRMEALRSIYESAGGEGVRTLLQSGNVVYRTSARDVSGIARKVEAAIEAQLGFRPTVVQRTVEQMRGVVAANPFGELARSEPSKLVVMFLAGSPAEGAEEAARSRHPGPEEFRLAGGELFISYPMGQGQSKMPATLLDRAFGVQMTGRNWNTVVKLLEMAESA
jgi:uncharacterized protein (DUF1697 family)